MKTCIAEMNIVFNAIIKHFLLAFLAIFEHEHNLLID